MIYSNKIKQGLKNPYFRQYCQLLGATGIMMVLQLVFTMLLTNKLSTEDFASYKQIFNTLLLFQSLFLFGWPFTISFLIAKAGDNQEKIKRYIGAGLKFIGAVVGVIYVGVVVVCGVQRLTGKTFIPYYWLWAFPFTLVPLLQYYLEYVAMGTNKIKFLSLEKFGTQIFAVGVLATVIYFAKNLTVTGAVFVYGLTHLFVLLLIFKLFNPCLIGVSGEIREINEKNKTVGLPTYIGGLCSVGSVRFVAVMVSWFVIKEQYAYFALALTISAPLSSIISSLGSILYKKFSTENSISKNFLRLITVTVFAIGLAFALGIQFFTPMLFGAKYANSIVYAQIMGVANLLVGFADVFNRFLASKGQGKAIQHGAIATGLANICASACLLPLLGVVGVCIGRVAADMTYLAFMVYKYTAYVKKSLKEQGQ